LIDYVSTIIN